MGSDVTTTVVDVRDGALALTSASSPISNLVRRPAVEVGADAPLAEAAAQMAHGDLSALLVEGAVGIVTERDIARAVGAGIEPTAAVGSVATPDPLVVEASTTMAEAAAMMLNEHIRHLVVRVPDGTTAVVSLRDVVSVLLQVADPALWLSTMRLSLDVAPEIWIG